MGTNKEPTKNQQRTKFKLFKTKLSIKKSLFYSKKDRRIFNC